MANSNYQDLSKFWVRVNQGGWFSQSYQTPASEMPDYPLSTCERIAS